MLGTSVGHYRILEKLGQGGMGVVYKAHDSRLERVVAVKLLSADRFEEPHRRQRLLQEARAAAALSHPNIVHIYEIACEERGDFIAMEFVDGVTLADRIPAGGMPLPQVLKIAVQVVDALAAAHAAGIVHRDLKPSNIMLTPSGQVKVLDFGLAKFTQGVAGEDVPTRTLVHTEEGMVVGTAAYMSPEQAEARPVDSRSDIFSFGSILYEMASGCRAFAGESRLATLSAVVRESPPPLPASVPPGLSGVIQRCLRKNPAERYQKANEVRAALEVLRDTPSDGKTVRAARTSLKVAAAAIFLVFLGAFAFYWTGARKPMSSRPQFKSIAVLPLQNFSADREQEYFADAMTEAVITDLGKIQSLKVISRTSVMPYKNSKKSMRAIASELQADAVIEGSVMRSADRVRITVQLIDASSDQHLWAESYERDLKNVIALQGEVAQAIAQQVRVVITPQEQVRLVRRRPVDPEVYELYLKGRHIMTRGGLEDVRKAIECFQSGLAKDPNNALCYTGLADAYIHKMSDVHESPVEATALARAAATKALELDESLAEAHTSLASIKLFYDWDWPGAEAELKRAMELNPGYAWAYRMYGGYLTIIGRHSEALPSFAKARSLDPLYRRNYLAEAYSDFMAHKYDDAIEQYRKGFDMEPDPMTYFGLVLALAEKGDVVTAISEGEKATKLNDSPLLLTSLASAYALAGRRADSHRLLRRLAEISKRQGPAPAWHVGGLTRYVCPYEVAGVYAQLGEKDRAFEWLDKAYRSRSCLYFLRQDPRLASIHSDPRFQELLRKMNFPQ